MMSPENLTQGVKVTKQLNEALSKLPSSTSKTDYKDDVILLRLTFRVLGFAFLEGWTGPLMKQLTKTTENVYARLVMVFSRQQSAFYPIPMAMFLFETWNP